MANTGLAGHEPLRIGLVGAGAIAQMAHMPAILASRVAQLGAVIDADISRAKELCDTYGVHVPVFNDIEAVDAPLDAAVVAVPNHLHAQLATRLLKKGLHVLVEKPLAVNRADAQKVVNLAESLNLTLAVGFHTRHSGACQILKRCIESERFGRALRFAHQDGSVGGWAPKSAYNLSKHDAGGGVLVTTGTHFLDRLIWLFGYPGQLEFFDDACGGPESHCIVHFGITGPCGKITGSAVFSKVIGIPENTVVETEKGILVMPRDVDECIQFVPKSAPDMRYSIGLNSTAVDTRSCYQRQLEDFVEACVKGRPPLVSGSDGLQVVQLVDDLYASRQLLDWRNTSIEASIR
jgi:predicted dehydrogenase